MPPRWLEPHSYPAAVGFRAAPSDLGLFERTVADLRGFVLDQDVVYVGGGNTASLLAVWRAHGLDAVMREAWEAGIVLCGSSAGMNCWFEASTTDSFDLNRLAGLPDGLGLLPGSACPHYDGEEERRPLLDGVPRRRFGGGRLARPVARMNVNGGWVGVGFEAAQRGV